MPTNEGCMKQVREPKPSTIEQKMGNLDSAITALEVIVSRIYGEPTGTPTNKPPAPPPRSVAELFSALSGDWLSERSKAIEIAISRIVEALY